MKRWLLLWFGLGLCLFSAESQPLIISADQVVEPYKYVTNVFSVPTNQILTFLPADDAYLQGVSRFNDNYLKVEAGNRVAYLKFNVSGLLSWNVRKATLWLQENGDPGNGTLRVYQGSHNNWTETSLTASNAPGMRGQVGALLSRTVLARQVVNIDVTPLVNSNGVYSIIIKMDTGGNDIWFGSKESTTKPKLVVEAQRSLLGPAVSMRKQIDSYFRVTNRHDGVVFLVQDRANTNEWRIEGVSSTPLTNYIVGSQSGEVRRLVLVSRPGQVPAVRRAPD